MPYDSDHNSPLPPPPPAELTMNDLGSYPMGANGLPLKINFEQRLRYKNTKYFLDFGLPKPLDSLYDKAFFGRVDRVQNAIVPRRLPVLFKQLGSEGNYTAFDFVANAFFKFRRNFTIASDMGGIETIQTVLAKPEATGGLRNYEIEYDNLFQTLITKYEGTLQALPESEFNKVLTFKDYVDRLYDYLLKRKYTLPITLTEFVLSPLGSPSISGIVVETANENYGEDIIKYTKYMSDINFSYYVRAARKFGFYVDKNAPWRLFADPLSPPMRAEIEAIWAGNPMPGSMFSPVQILDPIWAIGAGYATEGLGGPHFGFGALPSTLTTNAENMFFGYYDRTYTLDLYLLKKKLVAAWNLFAVANPRVIRTVPGTVRCPESYFELAALRSTVSEKHAHLLGHRYWFNWFINIREIETNVKYGDRPYILNRAMQILNLYGATNGYHEALKYLNNLFKPYLYDERFFANNPLTTKK